MKKIILITLLAVCFKTYAQLDYTFVKSTATYADLTSPTVVTGTWPTNAKMKMPFQFKFFTKPFDSLIITPNNLAFTKNQSDYITLGQENYSYFAGSEISYQSTGTTPNRILKVQFKNLRVNINDTSEEYTVNNQVWFYETTDVMEFHFGPNVITDINFTEFYFGFRDPDGTPYLAISGTVASPTLIKVTNVGTFKGIKAHPTDGTVYAFTPYVPTSAVSKVVKPYSFTSSSNSFSVNVNLVSTVVLCDVSGKKISEMQLSENGNYTYDYSALASGLYLVTINANNQSYTEKIIVQ